MHPCPHRVQTYPGLMARMLSFVAALLAVTAGVGSALAWIGSNLGTSAIGVCGVLLVACFGGLVSMDMAERGIPSHRQRRVFGALMIGALASSIAASVAQEMGLVALYVYVAFMASPLFWWAYQRDKRQHKECPDCCERIKAGARVCRYCGYEFAPLDST
jgi:archaellum biogenesis protein FlaJ (TadC family)